MASLPTLDTLKASVPESTSAPSIAQEWIGAFFNAKDTAQIEDLFLVNAFWRDIIALTSDIRTLHGWQSIKSLLDARKTSMTSPTLHTAAHNQPAIVNMFPDFTFIQFSFAFQTTIGDATAIVRLVPTINDRWKAYTVFTSLESLKNRVEKVGINRDKSVSVKPWETIRQDQVEFANRDPDVVIIGGGQTGLEIAARLKYLDVPTLVIERTPRIGDSWRNRYDSLVLHDTIWYDNLPYLPFPSSWPVYCSAGKLANFLEAYAETLELSVWTSSTVIGASWDKVSETWSITVDRNGSKRAMTVKHLVFAIGIGGGIPNIPNFADANKFKGKVFHSAHFKSAKEFAGKRAVVIGACNSAHDIAQDFCRHGADVTMYQRSSTFVISTKAIELLLQGVYHEGCILEYADHVNASFPYSVNKLINQRVAPAFAESLDKETLEKLNKVGFKTNLGPDNAGMFPLVYIKAGGYYINTGGSTDIIEGRIKVKNGSSISRFTESGLAFEDGTNLDADVIVLATGYGDPKDSITPVVGEEVSSKLKPIWNLDGEGELNSVYKESGHPGLWVAIGNLAMARYYGRALALRIAATLDGVLPPKY